ncbi:MAG: hypothetical protein RL481_1010 [Pseudomonadota bacterium]|jgi:carboxymethylenebutenolidase
MSQQLSAYQEHMLEVWQRHAYGEFIAQDPDIAIGTMGPDPYILAVPFGQLLQGREEVYSFYSKDFLPKIPKDMEMEPIQTIVAERHIVDEFIVRFTHDIEMPWQIPGIQPTGKKVELVMSVIVGFDGDLISYEHLMWDHSVLLYQIGEIDHPAAAGGLASAAHLKAMLSKRG